MKDDLARIRGVIGSASPSLQAFDYLLAHARAASFVPVARVGEVHSIELQWPEQRRNPFSIQTQANHLNFYLRGPILKAHAGLFVAATERFGSVKPNSRGEYRTHIRTVSDAEDMLAFLRESGAWPDQRNDRRFASETFEGVSGEHLLRAARLLADGFSEHPFGPSTDYDLLFEGQRLAPKAVFGLAASEALGFEVLPENFRGGRDTQCFRMLTACSFPVVSKSHGAEIDETPMNEDDRVWTEGRPRLVAHLRRERGGGLAKAKRDRFRAAHGRLFCERCAMDPIATFGSDLGEACIEVHHRAHAVADMEDGHRTRLDELQCLCANCHRVVHRELKQQVLAAT